MKIEVLGKIYEVLEIIPKKHEEYDLFVCTTPAGYKECFQYFDLKNNSGYGERLYSFWTEEDENLIKEKLLEGMTPHGISKKLKYLQHTEASIEERAKKIKKEMLIKESKPRFNIKF